MAMKNPPHPGLSVRHDCIDPFDLTITETADILDATRQTLNNLVNSKSGISPEMAMRLDKALGGGAETWLRLKMAYDLAQARQHEREIKVKRVTRRVGRAAAAKERRCRETLSRPPASRAFEFAGGGSGPARIKSQGVSARQNRQP